MTTFTRKKEVIMCGACHVKPAVPRRPDAPDAKLCEPCYQRAVREIGELVRKYGPTLGRR